MGEPPPRELGHTVVPVKVQQAVLGGSGHGEFVDTTDVLAAEVHEVMAPGVTRAKFVLNVAALGVDVWEWKSHLAYGDLLAILTVEDTPKCLFMGFVADVDFGWGAADENCTVTCLSNAHRLARGNTSMVVGRKMFDHSGANGSFSGIKCCFNGGGLGNKNTVVAGGGQYMFTADGDRTAERWTLGTAIQYLCDWYNPSPVVWMDWPELNLSGADVAILPEISVDGMSLWAAMAALCDRTGFDLFEEFYVTGLGDPASRAIVKRKHTGTRKTINHQGRVAGVMPAMDLAYTNLFTASIAESTTNVVSEPLVLGAAPIYEITIELRKAWDPARLAMPADGIVTPGSERIRPTSTFVKRYCTCGTQSAYYADCGRLWDANTDGKYSAAPYSLSKPDVALLAGQTAGTWPDMAYQPLQMLSLLGQAAGGRRAESHLDISFDNAASWQPLDGYELLHDRLGVRLTHLSLAEVFTGKRYTYAGNLFTRLCTDGANVRMWLTISVQSPVRASSQPAQTAKAGVSAVLPTSEVIDRGALGAVRKRAASSAFNGVLVGADEADESAALTAYAAAQQADMEQRVVEAALPIEWPDEAIYLGDTIATIAGINYALTSDAGRAPRVVARTLLLRPETWSMVLTLGTERKNPAPAMGPGRWIHPGQ